MGRIGEEKRKLSDRGLWLQEIFVQDIDAPKDPSCDGGRGAAVTLFQGVADMISNAPPICPGTIHSSSFNKSRAGKKRKYLHDIRIRF
jgi:hypothetical protein